jgi:hypothetical protein
MSLGRSSLRVGSRHYCCCCHIIPSYRQVFYCCGVYVPQILVMRQLCISKLGYFGLIALEKLVEFGQLANKVALPMASKIFIIECLLLS